MKPLLSMLCAIVSSLCVMPAHSATASISFNHPITIVVPYAPGGTADFLVRRIAQSMSEDLGQTVIVENRPGAATAVAAASVARSKPDGHTLMLASNATLAINQHRGLELQYSPTESFEYVSLLMSVPNIIAVPENSPFQSLEELIESSRNKAKPVTYGTMGIGTSNHIGMEVLSKTTNANLLHVPFTGSAPALTSLLGGHIDAVVDTQIVTLPHTLAGKLRPLATLGTVRSPLTPNVPTANEISGSAEDFTAWFGLVVPKNTPADIIEKLNRSAVKAMNVAETRSALEELGAEVVASSASEFKERAIQEQKMYEILLAPGNLDLQ